jgi:nitroreductase
LEEAISIISAQIIAHILNQGLTMELFDAINSRVSAARVAAPGPTPGQLQMITDAAARAPDHGRLRPWRIIPVNGSSRELFATAVANARRARIPDLTDDQMVAERDKINRSPCIIVVGCAVKRDYDKVPEVEQVLAVGAAVQNMFLAAHALGIGVMWKTGAAAYDAGVKTAVGLSADDHIIAILHLGTRVR